MPVVVLFMSADKKTGACMGWSFLIISKIVRLVSSVSMIGAEINGVTVVSVSL